MPKIKQDKNTRRISKDFDVKLIYSETGSSLFLGTRRDSLHQILLKTDEGVSGGSEYALHETHISRFIIAEAVSELNSCFPDGIPNQRISTTRSRAIGLLGKSEGHYDFAPLASKDGIPYEFWGSDLIAYQKAAEQVIKEGDHYKLPEEETPGGSPIESESRRLIEAIAFERVLHGELDATTFGVYSAFCSWKEFFEGEPKPRSFFESLIKGPLFDNHSEYDPNPRSFNGEFFDIASKVQERLFAREIWGPGIYVPPDEAVVTLQEAMSRLSSFQMTQFAILMGMHEVGLFVALAQVLKLCDLEHYIKWKNGEGTLGFFMPEQSLREDIAVINLLADLGDEPRGNPAPNLIVEP